MALITEVTVFFFALFLLLVVFDAIHRVSYELRVHGLLVRFRGIGYVLLFPDKAEARLNPLTRSGHPIRRLCTQRTKMGGLGGGAITDL